MKREFNSATDTALLPGTQLVGKILELKERFEENGVIGFKPSDAVLYKPRNEIGIVENITGCGILVSEFNQQKSNLCKPEDLEKL